jgi:hypothetical protein
MRLLKFMTYFNINDVDVNRFRAMSIDLTTSLDETNHIIKTIEEKYQINTIKPLIDGINKELKKYYTGKYSFGLCTEKTKRIEDFIKNKKKSEKILMNLFEKNDQLSRIKTILEEKLKK